MNTSEGKKIWLVGNSGMLGKQIEKELTKNNVEFAASDREVDITSFNEINDFIKNKNIDTIINCAAYTAVDEAEEKKEKANKINSEGPKNLAKAAIKINAELIHFSTDYVYSGEKKGKYTEEDKTDPLSVYGKSKLDGEKNIKNEMDRFFIIRLSWLYGVYGNSFVKTMVNLFQTHDELTVVNDQKGSPTYCGTLAENTVKLIRDNNRNYGVYNYSDGGEISWYDFAVRIKKIADSIDKFKSNVSIKPIPSSEFPRKADRPKNSVMDKKKIKKYLNFKVKDWESNLIEYFKEWEKINYEGI
ncbi:MAG: dTDP-4-dehydrorhamnose reductase [Candidatus Mcinerneyibacterium aminivorans]|uniref:dTDP-4-dehydrorhamnose reductase n=1 Tax=Candidatus Mcinerneyibacterium aminivorans TaxID=2703815 RepID=A0A5D0MED9_9BACT|nr:MAG: dTDP-4-dehydrorhamnose reductase [Candidatus Mcinerneyibacterium aminivorans]